MPAGFDWRPSADLAPSERWDAWGRSFNVVYQAGVAAIVTAGRILIEAKADIPHGLWADWLSAKTPVSNRTARKLMQIASDPNILRHMAKRTHESVLPQDREILVELCGMEPGRFDGLIATGTVHPEMKRGDVRAALTARRHTAAPPLEELPHGKWRAILADPPWAFETRGGGNDRAPENAQTGLRNAPASVVVANLPDAPPDVTVRWSASSDTSPYAVSNIEPSDTISLEILTDHEPVWETDISEGLRERVAANEVQLASINQQLRNDIANPVFRDILEIDDDSDWDGSTERFRIFSHTIADVEDGDFVEIDWLNFNSTENLFNHFAVHGSGETQGRFLFHGRDMAQRTSARPNTAEGTGTSQANGFIGATTATLRRQVGENLVDDPGGAVIWWFLYRVGTTVHLDAAASISRNPQGLGKMPEGFYMRFRTWRESAQVQSTRLLPDRPNAVEDRRGLVPKFDSEGTMVYAQPIGPVQLLAFRSRITGDWTLGAPTGELTVTDLGFSGTTLRINARKALRSKSYGVIVTVTRGSDEISRVVIPWALFRTGAGAFVTGGGHGTQGIPAGYWSDAANAYLVAHADWDFDNDRFELTIGGGTTDTNSILRVHLAR